MKAMKEWVEMNDEQRGKEGLQEMRKRKENSRPMELLMYVSNIDHMVSPANPLNFKPEFDQHTS
ncbi:unnamed protein product [Dovyalis caffra]|uniref:Uncharacterized protein n=1 Tax=Dovyalis caffra TaxID=77055 RepID=A0AAV1SSY7_9ROSI|nr:unnamed protein product [Dovyalis caffra]